MSPSEAADVLEESEIENFGLEVLETVVFDCEFLGSGADVGEEVSVRLGSVAAKVFQDFCERILRHGDLKEAVQEGNDGVVGTGLATEVLWLVVGVAVVDDTIGEERLVLCID